MLNTFNLLSVDPRTPCPSTDVAQRTEICLEAQKKLNTALIAYLNYQRSVTPRKDIAHTIVLMAHVSVKGLDRPAVLLGFNTADLEMLDADKDALFSDMAKIAAGAGLLFPKDGEEPARYRYRVKESTPSFRLCVRQVKQNGDR